MFSIIPTIIIKLQILLEKLAEVHHSQKYHLGILNRKKELLTMKCEAKTHLADSSIKDQSILQPIGCTYLIV